MVIKAGFDAWAVYSKYNGWHWGYNKDPGLFITHETLWYTADDGRRFHVPAGFLTDLGSIPPPLWGFLPRDRFPSSFILHDFLCEQSWMPRKDADKILREALQHNGASRFESNVIYYFVRSYVRTIKPIKKAFNKVKVSL